MEYLALILFLLIFILILKGYPVAFTLGGMSILFAFFVIIFFPDVMRLSDFNLLAPRIKGGIIDNFVMLAVPLFVFMGVMLEKSGIAENLLETMAIFFGKYNGGLAISVIIVGAMLAASTGIVGATVVSMGVISLPVMLKRKYNPELSLGVIASSGTLGQIIPPSVILILLATMISSSSRSNVQVDVGTMFKAAIVPSILIVSFYIIYILVISLIKPHYVPAIPSSEIKEFKKDDFYLKVIKAFVLPFILIFAVLGSIFMGLASPTEAAAVGAMGATILTIFSKKFNYDILKDTIQQTIKVTTMVFFIFIGATTFSLVFRTLGGDRYLVSIIENSNLSPMFFLAIVMFFFFVAGFFIDFIEIIFIFVPVVIPIFDLYNLDTLWIGILMAINLQTSFLTPPFGFALFYLKGVTPPEITTQQIYKGVVPFIFIQLLVLLIIMLYPNLLYIF